MNVDTQSKLDRGRKYNLKQELDARYNVFSGDNKKIKLLNNQAYISAGHIVHLFI